MPGHRSSLWVGLILWWTCSQGQAQTAVLEPGELELGEVATLVVELRTRIPSLPALDTSPLTGDFEVLSVSPSVSKDQPISPTPNLMRWELELFPLRAGELTIPSLEIEGKKTPALAVRVTDNRSSRDHPDTFLSLEAEPDDVYVGQQTQLTARLYHRFPILGGNLTEPESDELRIVRSGHASRYHDTLDGIRYHVLERTVAAFAESPGVITIPAITFVGTLQPGAADSREKRIKRQSKPLVLNVTPAPSVYSGESWLPAAELSIVQRWSNIPQHPKPGDVLSRTITIIARGLAAQALPRNLVRSGTGFRVYPDQPVEENRFSGRQLIGRVEQSYAVILSLDGDIQLPEITVSWWDSENNIERTEVLPGKALSVREPLSVTGAGSDDDTNPVRPSEEEPEDGLRWQVWAVSVLGVVLLLWLVRTRVTHTTWLSKIVLARRLKKACVDNDAESARQRLIEWAASNNAGALGNLQVMQTSAATMSFKSELARLDAALYSGGKTAWSGRFLWLAFLEERRAEYAGLQQVDRLEGELPALY